MTIIYGVDTDKPVSPADVRDAIIECFTQAHSEALDDLRNYADDISDDELEQIKRINVRQMIRNFFKESGGNFDNPDKESIMKVLEKLKIFAANFRNPELIARHYSEIITLVSLLK